MCIAILQKPNSDVISDKSLTQCAKYNNSGFGLMYCDIPNAKLYTWKSINEQDFINEYKKVYAQYGTISPIGLHCRLATHGARNESMAHPFIVSDTLAFMHNGVLQKIVDDVSPQKKRAFSEYSDTSLFNEYVLKFIAGDIISNSAAQVLIAKYDPGSKFIFMDNHGKYVILNESAGIWEHDIWYSNSGYRVYDRDITYWCTQCFSRSLLTPQEKECGVCKACQNKQNRKRDSICAANTNVSTKRNANIWCCTCKQVTPRAEAIRIRHLNTVCFVCRECAASKTLCTIFSPNEDSIVEIELKLSTDKERDV